MNVNKHTTTTTTTATATTATNTIIDRLGKTIKASSAHVHHGILENCIKHAQMDWINSPYREFAKTITAQHLCDFKKNVSVFTFGSSVAFSRNRNEDPAENRKTITQEEKLEIPASNAEGSGNIVQGSQSAVANDPKNVPVSTFGSSVAPSRYGNEDPAENRTTITLEEKPKMPASNAEGSGNIVQGSQSAVATERYRAAREKLTAQERKELIFLRLTDSELTNRQIVVLYTKIAISFNMLLNDLKKNAPKPLTRIFHT